MTNSRFSFRKVKGIPVLEFLANKKGGTFLDYSHFTLDLAKLCDFLFTIYDLIKFL